MPRPIGTETRCDALSEALRRFETSGWVQGSYARTAALNVSWAHPAASSFDLVGMLELVAAELTPEHAHELGEQLRADVCRTLGLLSAGFELEHWNDAPARTLDDVRDAILDTLRRLRTVRVRATA